MWLKKNYKTIIRLTYIVPILFAAGVSIAHVVTFYNLTNPLSWAIYLSIGIEVAALSALAGITAKMNKWVYFPFIIVTLIQFIGNVFFSFQFININNPIFLAWVDLVNPLFDLIGMANKGDLLAHKRWLALFAGGLIPVISLSFLHLLIKFNDKEDIKIEKIEKPKSPNGLIPPPSKVIEKMELDRKDLEERLMAEVQISPIETPNEAISEPIMFEPMKDTVEVTNPVINEKTNRHRVAIERVGANKIIKGGSPNQTVYKKDETRT